MSPDSENVFLRLLPDGVVDGEFAERMSETSCIRPLDVRFDHGGAWAGVENLIEEAYLDLSKAGEHAILDEHNYELHMVLARYRHRIVLKYPCLTDIATGVEKTRNFPLDRAYRLVHGLVALVMEWKRFRADDRQWIIAARGFEHAQHLATRFFIELARRAYKENIHVLVDGGADKVSWVSPALVTPDPVAVTIPGVAFPPLEEHALDKRQKDSIEASLSGAESWERNYRPLIACYRRQGDSLAAAKIALRALCLFNHFGYYYESASFVDEVLPHFDELCGDDQEERWNYLGNMIQGLISTNQGERALQLVAQLAEKQLTLASVRAKMHYLLAMIHLRYASEPNIPRAEVHILSAVDQIEAGRGEVDYADYVFLKVFIGNGLAFLRVRQGRQEEALQLCRSGYELLTRELGEERHRLHRSVLQYNAAQVYVMMGRLEDALDHYARSVEMDPYYSEYYNEIGNILQRQEKYEQALSSYDQAVKYSPPYPEVHYNKAICHVRLEQWEAARRCFSLSLELDPGQVEALLLRAETLCELGLPDAAVDDYSAALALSERNVIARVNRATVYFEQGKYEAALSDMDRVIEIEPENVDHRANRAEICKAMGLVQAVGQ